MINKLAIQNNENDSIISEVKTSDKNIILL